jgi:hypothetical protein
VAGIAAMVLTGILGTAMGLNNTATFMSSCVAFVAVSMWMDSRITRHRREETARESAGEETARETARDETTRKTAGRDFSLDADSPKRDGHGG